MCNRFTRLKCKEVVNVCDGARLGFVCDLELDVCTGQVVSLVVPGAGKCFGLLGDCCIELETGRVTAVVIPGPCRFLGLFGRDSDYVVPWCCIRRIGEDIILVDGPAPEWRVPRKKKGLF